MKQVFLSGITVTAILMNAFSQTGIIGNRNYNGSGSYIQASDDSSKVAKKTKVPARPATKTSVPLKVDKTKANTK